MEKIRDKIAALPSDSMFISLEFFPPRTQTGFSNLRARIVRMVQAIQPLFVNVSWAAGGSTAHRSLELADLCQRHLGLTTCLHLTCTNMKRELVDKTLEEAKLLGIRNILALRGDPPRLHEYDVREGEDDMGPDTQGFTWAIDLVSYIRYKYGDYFCLGVAAYPEGHPDLSYSAQKDLMLDLPYLVSKVEAGADFIMTQFSYDTNSYRRLERTLRGHESAVFKSIPIIAGLMPIQGYDLFHRTARLAHVKVPQQLQCGLDAVKGDDDAVKAVGFDVVKGLITELKEARSPCARGFHFFTMNLEKSVTEIISLSGMLPPEPKTTTPESAMSRTFAYHHGEIASTKSLTPLAAQLTANLRSKHSPSQETGTQIIKTGDLHSRDATWDDYPNGRFGDARSPAFNPPIGYSSTAFSSPIEEVLALWGSPTSDKDIGQLFLSHIKSRQPGRLPWSESILMSPETTNIKDELAMLTEQKCFWTIASQPVVNGVPSDDHIHGWGPFGGFVFQKPFVEFFVRASYFQTHLRPKLEALHAQQEVSFYAVTASGNYQSSEQSAAVHAVTWGSFKGKEITTATMVDEVSFRAWGEEAFGIWTEWSRCIEEAAFGEKRHEVKQKLFTSRDYLRSTKQNSILVNVIGHQYQDISRLWTLLASI